MTSEKGKSAWKTGMNKQESQIRDRTFVEFDEFIFLDKVCSCGKEMDSNQIVCEDCR